MCDLLLQEKVVYNEDYMHIDDK